MKRTAILASLFAGLTCAGQAASVILSDTFPTASVGSVPGWTKIGSNLFGQGVGVEANANHPGSPTELWAFFQTDQTGTAGIYRSTGTVGLDGQTVTLTFDLGGNSGGNLYTGAFTASIWDGNPTAGGTQLSSVVPANPAAGAINVGNLSYTFIGDTTGDLYVQLNAGTTGTGNGFRQAIADNVLVTIPEPSAALLGGLGALALLRRRRN